MRNIVGIVLCRNALNDNLPATVDHNNTKVALRYPERLAVLRRGGFGAEGFQPPNSQGAHGGIGGGTRRLSENSTLSDLHP